HRHPQHGHRPGVVPAGGGTGPAAGSGAGGGGDGGEGVRRLVDSAFPGGGDGRDGGGGGNKWAADGDVAARGGRGNRLRLDRGGDAPEHGADRDGDRTPHDPLRRGAAAGSGRPALVVRA